MSYETQTWNRERWLWGSHQGKRARYNAPTEEMLTNTSNNEQVPAVRAPQNYLQVPQAPVPTHIQMDIDKEGSGMGQFPALPKPRLRWETIASMVTILCGANWMPARELRPTVGLPGGLRGNMMPQANSLNIRTKGELDQYHCRSPHIRGVGQHIQTCVPMCEKRTYRPKSCGAHCKTLPG